jgi:UDPglucose 6-dehydrogenase
MRIAIIGIGHVGTAMHELFRQHAQIVTYDLRAQTSYPAPELATCDAAIVCVDTPPARDGACDISHVRDAVGRLPTGPVLLKSTVPPGTTDLLAEATGKQVCFWPEYAGQSSYHNPYWPAGPKDVPFVILGGEPPVRRWFIDLLQPVLGPAKAYFQCSAREAELIKYMENAYLATKVTFVNEFRRICEAFGTDWHTVREGWLLDPRIERAHTAAFSGASGFGGKCLPKDLSAIIRATTDAGYIPDLLTEVLHSNRRFCTDARGIGPDAPAGPTSALNGGRPPQTNGAVQAT